MKNGKQMSEELELKCTVIVLLITFNCLVAFILVAIVVAAKSPDFAAD